MTTYTSADRLWTIREIHLGNEPMIRIVCTDLSVAVSHLRGRPIVRMADGYWIEDVPRVEGLAPYVDLADLEERFRPEELLTGEGP